MFKKNVISPELKSFSLFDLSKLREMTDVAQSVGERQTETKQND